MAINKNHEFEDLNSIKCAIVERNVTVERMTFLKNLLSNNKFEVIIVEIPAAVIEIADDTIENSVKEPIQASKFTLGVTDLSFNAINAVFGRLLHSPDGHIVTLAYWKQQDALSDDTIPYFDHK